MATSATGQTADQSAALPADSLRFPTPPAPPDSLATSAGPVGTLQLQGQPRPSVPFQTFQEQLRTVAGVQVSPYSGAPGAMQAVRIRGAASLAGNPQPLYVVDGIPVFEAPFWKGAEPNQSVYFAATPADLNPLLSLANEDIESVRVLKGPLETARYGSQGQNGVVEISTRRGRFGQGPRVRYSGVGGVQQARYRYDLLSARDYAKVANEVAFYRGTSLPFTAAQVAALGAGTDWQGELLRRAAVQEQHLSVEGGSANTRAYVGADYLGQTGILVNSRLRRFGLTANLEQRLGARLRLTLGAALSETSARQPQSSVTFNMLTADPTQASRDARGQLIQTNAIFANPLRQTLQTYEEPRQRRLLSHLDLVYNITTGLNLELRAGVERTALHLTGNQAFLSDNFLGGRVLVRDDTHRRLTLRPALGFARTLAGRHVLTARLEFWRQHYADATEYRTFYGRWAGSPVVSNPVISSGGGTAEHNLARYQAQASYGFAGRYEVQGSLSHDGSSTRAIQQRWMWLPAGQLTWHAGQEAFLRDNRLIRHLDAWAGWGRTGTGNIYAQSYRAVIVASGAGAADIITIPQTEQTTQQEAGLRLGLNPQQLEMTLTAYQRQTAVVPGLVVPPAAPYAKIRNRGLELTLAGTWSAGTVRGNTALSVATNHNRAQTTDILISAQGQRLLNNQPLSTFYGLRYQGVDAATGRPRYQDVNSDGTLDYNDRQPLGSGLPRQLLSLTQQLSYRRLTLQAQLDGMFDYQVYNTNLLLLDAPDGYANASGRVRNRWRPGNPAAEVPAAGSAEWRLSDYLLQSGSHGRLTSLTLSFRVWEKGPRNASVWVGGNNLLVISAYRGFDPNVSSGGQNNQAAGLDAGAYPLPRTVSVGVRATL